MPQGRDALALWINERVFYGWLMLVVAAIGMFASGPGQSHLFSVFIPPISEDLGISRTSISSAYGLATLVAAFGLPYMGRLVDRHGVRSVLIVVALLLGFSALAFGTVANLALLALGFGALRFFGQGSLMLSCANLVAQWFDRKRGFALSLMALGFSASVAVHPPLAQWLIDQVGWRQAWLWLGLITWLLLVPVVVLLVQDKPEDLGLKPDGASRRVPSGSVPSQSDATGAPESAADSADAGLTIRQAIRTPAFWITALSLATFSMLATGLFFHQVSIFASLGLSPQVAARVFPVSAITMVLAMPVVGRMLDRLPTRPTFAAAMLSMSAGTVSLLAVRDVRTALLYAVVFGISNAAINAHLSYLWPRFFGRRHLGSIQGLAQTIAVIGASIGPVPLAFAFDQFGDYRGALITLSLLPVLCAIATLFMRPPRLDDDAACKAACPGALATRLRVWAGMAFCARVGGLPADQSRGIAGIMRQNQALARQRAGKTTFGPGVVYDSADLAEQIAHMGFDWVWLDWQHGQFTEATLNNALARFLAVGSAPIVRVKGHEPGTINRVLDMGAMGVIVPMVQNAEQAAAAVEAAFYPPKGRRSAGGVRLELIGGSFEDYCARANDEIMLVVMVESEAAIGQVREIMAVPGVDVVLIGPGDLMIDVKAKGHDAAQHERLVETVAEASRESGTAAGYVCGSVEMVERRLAQGFRFINYGLDHFALIGGMREVRAQVERWAGANR